MSPCQSPTPPSLAPPPVSGRLKLPGTRVSPGQKGGAEGSWDERKEGIENKEKMCAFSQAVVMCGDGGAGNTPESDGFIEEEDDEEEQLGESRVDKLEEGRTGGWGYRKIEWWEKRRQSPR